MQGLLNGGGPHVGPLGTRAKRAWSVSTADLTHHPHVLLLASSSHATHTMAYTITNPLLRDRINTLCKTLAERDPENFCYHVKPGGVYARVERRGPGRGQATAHAFVRLADGMLMKAASWGAPQVRGERFELLSIKGYGQVLRQCDWRGDYLRVRGRGNG